MPNLPHQTVVDRSRAIEPYTIPDPEIISNRGSTVTIHVVYGPLPGDPAHVLRPLLPGRDVR